MRLRFVLVPLLLIFANASSEGLAHSESHPTRTVVADFETEPVSSAGDAADDTTVWVNSLAPADSLIVATDKKSGLLLYSLQGKKIAEYPVGKINNIDSRAGIEVNGKATHLLVGSNRDQWSIAFFKISETSKELEKIGSVQLAYEPYGICVGHVSGSNETQSVLSVFVTTKMGPVDQWSIAFQADGEIKATNHGQIIFGSQTEGCVVDDDSAQLFVAEETVGLWRMDLKNTQPPVLMDRVSPDGNLVADVEGIAIHQRPDLHSSSSSKAHLVVSSQGDNSFHIYDLTTGSHLGSITIGDGAGVDGVTDTDGIEIASGGISPEFPEGFMIAQDGTNTDPSGQAKNQNFKIVDWKKILSELQNSQFLKREPLTLRRSDSRIQDLSFSSSFSSPLQ